MCHFKTLFIAYYSMKVFSMTKPGDGSLGNGKHIWLLNIRKILYGKLPGGVLIYSSRLSCKGKCFPVILEFFRRKRKFDIFYSKSVVKKIFWNVTNQPHPGWSGIRA